jgi:hypothetical protein
MVGKPSPTMPFTSPAKRKMPETMSSSLMVPLLQRGDRLAQVRGDLARVLGAVVRPPTR